MILSISKFKLYYPNGDSEYGGGGDEGGAKESDPSSDPGTSTPTGTPTGFPTGGNNGNDNGSGNGGNNAQIAIHNSSLNKDSISNFSKKITHFTTNVKSKRVKPSGETRLIVVRGTPNSIFSIKAVDSSDCSILAIKRENVVIPPSGKYTFKQEFPSTMTDSGVSKTKETYTFTITQAANVELATNKTFHIYQIADPVITITNTTSQKVVDGGVLSVSGSDVTITGKALSSNYNKVSATKYELTVTGSSTGGDDASESLYSKRTGFDNNITSSAIIKKVVDRCGETGFTNELILKPLTTRTETTIEGEDNTTGKLKVGMTMNGSVTYTKTLVANLDEDDNVLDYNKCKTLATRFELSDTNDITKTMRVYGSDENTHIASIDCGKKITLFPRQTIKKDTDLIFYESWDNTITRIINDNGDKIIVKMLRPMNIVDGTVLEFTDDRNSITGHTTVTGSGSDTLKVTCYIKPVRFGDKNVTYTLDLDKLVSNVPNAYDRVVSTKKNTAVTMNIIANDGDRNASAKTGTVTRTPDHGTVATTIQAAGASSTASTDSLVYTPHNGFTGEDIFFFKMTDGAVTSEERKVRITVK
jgi:hypothetical protein